MERRYLAAILAMAATFAVFSNGLQSKLVDRFLQQKPDLVSEMKCATRAVGAKLLAKINPSLRPEDLDAARLLAKLNLFGPDTSPTAPPAPPVAPELPEPPAAIQAQLAAAQVDCPEVIEAQEKALRSAERMQRNVERMQAKLEKSQHIIVRAQEMLEPVVFEVPSAEEINRQVQMSIATAQARAAAQAVQVRVATKALTNAQREVANLKLEDMNIEVAGVAPVANGFSRTQTVELQRRIDRAMQRANQMVHQQTTHGTPTHL